MSDERTGSPADKPAFLDPVRAEALGYRGAPDERPTFDYEFEPEALDALPQDAAAAEPPSRGIITRYREVARRHAYGQTNNQICEALGYTPSRMSLILKDTFVQSEIEKCRALLFDSEALDRIKEASRDGAAAIHALILDPRTPPRIKLAASTFAVEKTHGKPRQEVAVEHSSLQNFTDLLERMVERGEVLDVTPSAQSAAPALGAAAPAEEPTHDQWSTWLDVNLSER